MTAHECCDTSCRKVQTGRDRDWLYIVHINNGKVKGDWKKSGPTIPDLDRALQAYSYDIVELQGDSAAGSLVAWTASEDIDVLIVGSGKSGLGRRLPNPILNRTTDFIAANATCATLVIHPKACSPATETSGTRHTLSATCSSHTPFHKSEVHLRTTPSDRLSRIKCAAVSPGTEHP